MILVFFFNENYSTYMYVNLSAIFGLMKKRETKNWKKKKSSQSSTDCVHTSSR